MTLLDYLKAEGEAAGVPMERAKERLAVALGVSVKTVHNWAYDHRTPLAESIKKISDATGGRVGLNDFTEGKNDAKKADSVR